MAATCLADQGVGLAAPQIGIFKQVILIQEPCDELAGELLEDEDDNGEPSVVKYKLYVNPSWEPVGNKNGLPGIGKVGDWEACLSVPGKRLYIERFDPIRASWFEYSDETQAWVFQNKKILTGFHARVFQHEVDHLCGRSIVQRWEQQDASMRIMAEDKP